MTHSKFFVAAAVALLVSLGGVAACATGPEAKGPRVLIIGDSISLGYTPLVKQKLTGTAEVLRPNDNCQHTAYGLKHIDAWLGDGRWDVIHFNFGIWDSHLIGPKGNLVWPEPAELGPNKQRHTTAEYKQNLAALVAKMKATGATVIWASTTPVMSRTGERFEAIKQLNAAAAETAAAEKLEVNDLYEFVMPNAEKWLAGDKVHFSGEGNKQLADKVSASIAQALAKRAKTGAR